MNVYPLEQRTIGNILADKVARIPEQIFLLWEDRSFTYADIDAMTNRYANGFLENGVRKGDHVAVLMSNCPEFFGVIWGLGKIGAVAVPINTAAKGEMLRYFIDQSDSTFVVIDSDSCQRVKEVSISIPKVQAYFFHSPDSKNGNNFDIPNSKIINFDVLENAKNSRPSLDIVRFDDIHLIMYTSGTTGPSKGVMSPHSQGHAVGMSVARSYGYRSDDVLFTCLPLFHGNALWYTCYAALWSDAAIALVPRFSASNFWEDIRRMGATQFNSLGAMTNIIWKIPPSPQDSNHKLRQCMTVPVPREIYSEMQERYHLTLTSVYAMTENFAVTLFTPDDPIEKVGSAGKSRGEALLKIVDDERQSIGVNEVGEICVKPTSEGLMMKGYYKMPEATAREFHEGWFYTGDRGYLDADGYLFFVDRKKESIRRRGENISAYEVELIISRHPSILEVAAVPVSSELSEDDVMVYVVLKPGETLTHSEVVHFAAENMSYFMVPRFVEFIEELPKTPSEKLEKYKLKKSAEERREQLWDREQEGIQIKR
ncbi:MAG: AMP-binding protein [Burkholderiaceae bacterium]